MKCYKQAGFVALLAVSIFVAVSPANHASAASYNLTYHSNPNAQNCSWVYRWKWVYGKKVRVKVKVCN